MTCLGCYDGCVYALHRHTGAIHYCARLQTAEADDNVSALIKARVAFAPNTNYMIIGAHDKCVHLFDFEVCFAICTTMLRYSCLDATTHLDGAC
jgi:hypothetical protein